MANPKHLGLLNLDVQAWNAWRRKNPDVDPNLAGASLAGANLCGADLRKADLRGADLSYANLRGADLSRANLRGADLLWASVAGANLTQANLSHADLRGTGLSEALARPDSEQRCNESNARRQALFTFSGVRRAFEPERRDRFAAASRPADRNSPSAHVL